jgi:ephrin-A
VARGPTAAGAINNSRIGQRKLPVQIKRSHVQLIDKLGSGTFGEVWKAELNQIEDGGAPGYLVAVKMVKPGAPATGRLDLLKEVALMAQFVGVGAGHPNVISLVGLVDDDVGATLAVVVYCENGSLDSYLKKCVSEANPADLNFRLAVGVQIAAAMAFLASRGVVHRDLAARNVLIDSRKSARVSDFGMARNQNSGKITHLSEGATERESAYAVYSTTSMDVQVPVRWTAPEVFESMRFTTSSDVWAFGMLMVEVYTDGKRPFRGLPNAAIFGAVMTGTRPERPEICPPAVYTIMQQCWILESTRRPSFESISSHMHKLSQTSELRASRLPTWPATESNRNYEMPVAATEPYYLMPTSIHVAANDPSNFC